MAAFAAPSPFAFRTVSLPTRPKISPSKPLIRHVFMAKKTPKRPPTPGNAPRGTRSPAPSTFGGMAAGPGAPSHPSKPSSLAAKTPPPLPPPPPPPQQQQKQKQHPATEDVQLPAEDMQPEPLSARAVRALGQKKPRPAPGPARAKTAADFIAEGVEDDADDDAVAFQEEDIRFGIDDLSDPFLEDEKEDDAKRRADDEARELATVGKPVDVTGDGGVMKTLVSPGVADVVCKGAQVTVQYTGTLEDGSVFDDSRKRSGGFSFELGAGQVIKGWEAGVATMRRGETAKFSIAPAYAYGRRGMPPVIPGNSSLNFEIQLTDFQGGELEEIKKVEEFNPDVARTPVEIAKQYDARLETQEERRKGMSFLERFYIISPFASQTGERPPWWINPNITFVAILAFCAFGFYLVIIAGGVHIGYVDGPIDVNIFK